MSSFINEYNTMRESDYSVITVVEFISKHSEVSDINNVTAKMGKTILALGEGKEFSISPQLQNRDLSEIKSVHKNLKDLSTSIDTYIKNRSILQKLSDIITFRFLTLANLKNNGSSEIYVVNNFLIAKIS